MSAMAVDQPVVHASQFFEGASLGEQRPKTETKADRGCAIASLT
jgi:hypothetical protein